ncbi:MAG: PEP-CTERM sorting domain-containing protein [Prosthecobacter sp.]
MKTITSTIRLLTAAATLAFSLQAHAASLLPLDPYPYYRPLGLLPGQTYGIAGFFRIDPTNTPDPFQGASIAGANPNVGNAFPSGIGVYSPDTGHFGIGLYDNAGATRSTGLFINFDHLVSSKGLSVSVGNFGLDSLASGFDAGRVAPVISIYGVGNTLLGSFDAKDIIDNNIMTLLTSGDPLSSKYDPVFKVDTWKLDIEALVGANRGVRALALGADLDNGKGAAIGPSSAPYYLISVQGCTPAPIPEPGSAFLILSAALGLMVIRRHRH